jgi:hypothetical protein
LVGENLGLVLDLNLAIEIPVLKNSINNFLKF